jgi:hypothetical protein
VCPRAVPVSPHKWEARFRHVGVRSLAETSDRSFGTPEGAQRRRRDVVKSCLLASLWTRPRFIAADSRALSGLSFDLDRSSIGLRHS